MINQKYIFDIETSGLHGIEDKISCISILNIQTDEKISFCGEDEKKILTDFWKAIDGALEIYGYNSNSFDWVFITQRTLINNIPVCPTFSKIKLTDLRLISTAFFTCYNKNVKGTLDQWENHLIGKNKETNGEEMIEAYKRKDWKLIKEHCEEDCVVTKELYNRIVNCGLIK